MGTDSGRGTYLEDADNGHSLWASTLMFTVPRYRVITQDEWNSIQSSLDAQEFPPIYSALKHDAQENMGRSNYRSALIELAMTCEIFLRSMVLKRLPSSLSSTLVVAIEEVNISQYVAKHFRALVTEKDEVNFGKLSKELTSLFDKRNKLLHMGKSEGVTKENCERFLRVANDLLNFEHKLSSSESNVLVP